MKKDCRSVGENVGAQIKSKFSFRNFFLDFLGVLKTTYLQAFFFYFVFLFVSIIYSKLISQIAYLFTSFSSFDFSMVIIGNSFEAFLLLMQLPLLYLFFILLTYLSKIMFAKKLKTKDLFLVGFRQFILFLLFLLIPVFIASVAGGNETIIIAILAVLFLLAGFFMFVMLNVTLTNSLFDSFFLSIKQILSPKAGLVFVVVGVLSFVIFGLSSLLIYYDVLPELLNYLVIPVLLIFVLFGAKKATV